MAEIPGQLNRPKIKCPSCGFENILGSDRCEHCFHTLMQTGLPQPKKDDKFQQAIMVTPVLALLTGKDLLVCSPEDTVQKVVRVFQKEDKGCILVYDQKKLVGILSNRDLLLRVAGRYKDLSKVKIKEVMTRNPEYVTEDAPIAYIVNRMAMGGCRHVPVLATDGHPYSIAIIKDVLSFLSRRSKAS
ncbi:MAG: CBS domain-containing protein [Candidatus Omnitrophica bacterium]|nr:CBS domain-containing protein [Candidatus Omnitrophota bacterium]